MNSNKLRASQDVIDDIKHSPEIILSAKQLSKRIKTADTDLTILEKIDLKIELGETIALEGVSGSGKTTLLSLLAGLELPSSGQIWLMGQSFGELSEEERTRLRGESMGFVFQSFELLHTLNALENVMLPLELQGRTDPLSQAKDVLNAVGLSHRLDHYPQQLSGGEQQRVAIARAFVLRPKIVFADEPTANIDQKTGHSILDHIFELNRIYQTSLVFATHDPTLSNRCARTWVLDNGHLNEQ